MEFVYWKLVDKTVLFKYPHFLLFKVSYCFYVGDLALMFFMQLCKVNLFYLDLKGLNGGVHSVVWLCCTSELKVNMSNTAALKVGEKLFIVVTL